jgi:phosphopantetheinyl transferase
MGIQHLLHNHNCLVYIQDDLPTHINAEISEYFFQKLLNQLNIDDKILTFKNGKPHFAESPIQFNISHSGNVWMAAFCKYPIGVDAEERSNQHLINHIDPLLGIQNLDDWCCYEAIIKCLDIPLDDMMHIKQITKHQAYLCNDSTLFLHNIGFNNYAAYLASEIPNLTVEVFKNSIQ